MKFIRLLLWVSPWLLLGCEAAENVSVLPLPALEHSTPEARLGLPEVEGEWRFTGWEIAQGDSTALERSFPVFQEVRLDTQRLDSVAGSFATGGNAWPAVGEIRRDGRIALVTLGQGDPNGFLAGIVARDTLWLEITSVVAGGEWPQGGRAAFVRGPAEGPIAWLRGARPADLARIAAAMPPVAVDSAADLDAGRPEAVPAAPSPSGARPRQESRPPIGTPAAPLPTPPSGPVTPAPRAAPPPPATLPSAPPAPRDAAEPEGERRPEVEPEPRREPPRLLGVPVD